MLEVSTEHPASTSSSSDIYTTETCDQTPVATDLLKPRDEAHKSELLQKGPNQPTRCDFPKKRFSNGNLSFNPTWYELKEARGWLEYSVPADRMYCLSCRLFESELNDKNEPNWIRIGFLTGRKV